jgi:transcriptional regulator with XRE-family HTH domain
MNKGRLRAGLAEAPGGSRSSLPGQARVFDNVDGYAPSYGFGQPCDGKPVARRDTVSLPHRHGASLETQFLGEDATAPKGVDDRGSIHAVNVARLSGLAQAEHARSPCITGASNSGTMAGMRKKTATPLGLAVSLRLRAVQAELGKSDAEMAELVGASSRTVWSNWVNDGNMPEEEAMLRLCDEEGLTMDWIYRGVVDGVKLARVIRLTARLRGLNPDEATAKVLVEPLRPEQMVRVGGRGRA